jgi:hypothetical protein
VLRTIALPGKVTAGKMYQKKKYAMIDIKPVAMTSSSGPSNRITQSKAKPSPTCDAHSSKGGQNQSQCAYVQVKLCSKQLPTEANKL